MGGFFPSVLLFLLLITAGCSWVQRRGFASGILLLFVCAHSVRFCARLNTTTCLQSCFSVRLHFLLQPNAFDSPPDLQRTHSKNGSWQAWRVRFALPIPFFYMFETGGYNSSFRHEPLVRWVLNKVLLSIYTLLACAVLPTTDSTTHGHHRKKRHQRRRTEP